MRIKICGITSIEDALACERLGADAIGYIFYRGSKRFIEPEAAREISSTLPAFIGRIGVFVDEDPDEVNRIAREALLTSVQLSGDESPEYCDHIALPVIKGFRVKQDFDFAILEQYKTQWYLLDAWHPDEYGGTGSAFDWEAIPADLRRRIILAGGINEQNLEDIKTRITPAGIDLSSAVESAPGKKDHKKLESFFTTYHSLWS